MDITIKEFQNLVSDNEDAEMAYNLGVFSEKHNDFEAAINHYSKSLMYDNTYAKAYFNRAKCYGEMKLYEKAIVDFKNYVQFILETDKITLSEIHLEIGQLQGEKGDAESALKSFIKSVEYYPLNLHALELRGTLYSQLGKPENAIADYLEVKKLDIDFFNNSPNILLNLPILDNNMELSDKIIFTERGIKLNPNYEIGYYNLGLYYKKANLYEKAIKSFERANLLAPTNLDILQQLSQLLADKKEYTQLKIYLEKLTLLGDIHAKRNLDNLNDYFKKIDEDLISKDTIHSYKLLPVISTEVDRTEFGIDVINEETLEKISIRINESFEFEFGTPEYDYSVETIGEEGEMPKIHIWVVTKLKLCKSDDNEFNETNTYSTFEFYRGESIYHPSKEYDNMFEKIIKENLGNLAQQTLIEFVEVDITS